MSVRVMTKVWDAPFPTPTMKLVALKLADCANDEGENIYPSVGRVERETGVSSSVVRDCIADMEAVGLLVVCEVIREAKPGKLGRSSVVRAFDLDLLKVLAEGERTWCAGEQVVRDLKTGAPKIDPATGEPKTRKVWRLTGSASGSTSEGAPLRQPDPYPSGSRTPTPPAAGPYPSGSRTPPLRQPDPSYKDEPSFEPSDEPSLSPYPTAPADSGRGRLRILDELKAEGQPEHVVDGLIGTLMRAGLSIPKRWVEPIGPLRQMCADHKRERRAVLEHAANALLAVRKVELPSVADVRDAVERSRKSQVSTLGDGEVAITARDHPEQWAAWWAWADGQSSSSRTAQAIRKIMQVAGVVIVPSAFPPPSHVVEPDQGAA